MQFRKKPVIIDAEQYSSSRTQVPRGVCTMSHAGLSGDHVHTLEGTSYILTDGDWIIRGVKGEYYPCKPDIFAQTYEPV